MNIYFSTDGIHVAILHPRKLRVMRVTISGDGEQQLHSHCNLDLLYEHDLILHGFSLCVGPFWLCVLSLSEATLSFFENERIGMTCRLPALSLLPSPLCYVPSTESFIVVDPSWNLHSYRLALFAFCDFSLFNSFFSNLKLSLIGEFDN